jgi:oxygen-dependent protoporphyrinogen oxidase
MRVAVVGGGMAGLAAAHELATAGVEVVVLEGSDRLGGKLRLGEVGGLTLDLGAESILARRPEGLDLIHAVGLDDRVVHPATITASIWTHGALRAMPPTVMGIPADPAALAASGIADMPDPRILPAPDEDISVAEFVTARLGRDVLDRLVEPLLGGVYAGHTDQLSLRATTPQIAALGDDLLTAAAEHRAAATATGPVFAGLVGGVGQLPAAVAATPGIEVRLDATVRAVGRTPEGWRLSVGPTTDVEVVDVDAVIIAAPAPAAARLLAEEAPDAAFALAAIDYASMAIVTFVLDDAVVPEGSGFLVPPVDGTFIKAATVSSSKWGWIGESGRTVIRTSAGPARPRCCSTTTWTSRPARSPTCGPRSAACPTRPTGSSSAGAVGCRSTTSATSTGSRPSSARSPGCRGSRSAVRPTVVSASPRSSGRAGPPPAGCSTLGQSTHD